MGPDLQNLHNFNADGVRKKKPVPFFNFRIIDSPLDGTKLSQEEIANTLLFFGQNADSKTP